MMHEKKPKGIKTAGNTRISSNALTEVEGQVRGLKRMLEEDVTAWIS